MSRRKRGWSFVDTIPLTIADSMVVYFGVWTEGLYGCNISLCLAGTFRA